MAAQSRYHGLVAWIDDQIGELLDGLDRLGLRDDTIVVFSSDHGAHLGELGGAYSKQTFSPWSHRVPFLLSWPGHLDRGVEDPELARGVDLGPTLMDLAGLEPADDGDGRSLLRGPEPEHMVSAIGYGVRGIAAMAAIGVGFWPDGTGWPQRVCVRSRRWRYDRSTRRQGAMLGPDEHDPFLCDTAADGREEHNLVHDPRYADVAAALEAVVAAEMATAVQVADDHFTAATQGA